MAGRRDVPQATLMRALGQLGLSEAELARTRSVVITPAFVWVELFRLNALGGVLVGDDGAPVLDHAMIMVAEGRRPPLRVGPAKTGPHLNAERRTGGGA